MILNIQKVKTRVAILHSIPKFFFKKLEDSKYFGDHLFPSWSVTIFADTTLKNKFETVYNSYKSVKVKRDRIKIIKAFENGNEIEKLCNNDPTIEMITISDLHISVKEPIEKLFSYLYNTASKYPEFTNYVNKTIPLSIDDFIKIHKLEVCPICGLEGFHNLDGQARLALDHWLCQDIFPFSSVNFNNLLPIGDDCNSRPAKGEKNVLLDNNARTTAYYPYKQYNGINARFSFKEEPSFENENGIWDFVITPKNAAEIDFFHSWDSTFNIKTRYKSFVEKNILTMWQETYKEYINDHEILDHATDLNSFKSNLIHWKASFMKKKYPRYKAYRSFINHLLNDVSEAYLTSLFLNLSRY